MKLGLSSYTFGWAVGTPGFKPALPLDELALLDRCSLNGISLLQIGDNLPLHTFTEARLNQLAARAAAGNVELEVGMRGLTIARVKDYVGIARRLGSRILRAVIDEGDYEPPPSKVESILREVLPALDGVTLAIENHDRFPAQVLQSMILSVNSERVGICLDTANNLGAGEGLDTVLTALAPHVVNLHIKDFSVRRASHLMGFNVEGRPAGSGLLNIPRLLNTLRQHGRCETAILELWTPPEPLLAQTIAKEAAWATQSLDYLKPLFPKNAP